MNTLDTNNIYISKLGGLNNSNYLIKFSDSKFVLRIPSKDNNNNFYYENEILNIIKPFNISPEIIFHDKESGILLSKYIKSQKFNIEFYNSTIFINKLVTPLKKLHILQCSNSFSPFKEIYNNINLLHNINYEFNHDINFLVNKLKELEKDLSKDIHYGLCHNDLNTSNILYSNDSIYFIDFEFAGMGDVFFDLATISWFLEDELKDELIKSYFGYINVNLKNKLKKYLFVVKLWNATWSFIKSVNNTTDYDYRLGGNMILDDLMNNSKKY
ncbi:choline kinase family protein [uncultured Clostridium sp.]|uniref:choline kinase family protein n=1 Tax=uncultured Clostridium sp. TaxID=59620 RepID=UPI00280B1DB0|nr:choline kinase family protein [uncultured Clostridium sp.]